MKALLFILLFVHSFLGMSQSLTQTEQVKVDSFNLVVNDMSNHDTSIARSYLGLSEILYLSDFDTLPYLCKQAISIAENGLNFSSTQSIQRSFLKTLGGAYNNLGYYYDVTGDTENALRVYHKSLKIEELSQNKQGLAAILNNIGLLYHKKGTRDKVLDYFVRSLALRKEIGDREGEGICLGNIGYFYDIEGDQDKALEYYLEGLEIQLEIDDKIGIAYSYNNIAYVYKVKGEPVKALKFHKKGLEIQEDLSDKRGMAINLYGIAEILYENKNFSESKQYAIRSYRLAEGLGMPDIILNASEILSGIYEKENQWKIALEYHKTFVLMKDSLTNEKSQKLIANQQAKYIYEKQKVVDDAAHEKKKVINDAAYEKRIAVETESKEKQRIIIFSIAIGLLLMVVFLIFVFNRLRLTKKQKEIIESQNVIVLQSHNELEVKNREILDSIIYAKRIQSAILPPDKTVKKYLEDSFIIYKPKDIVAGDFYWLEEQKGKVLFAVADCTGHGVPGAMVSVVCNNALNRSVREHYLTTPGEILCKSREIIIEEFEKSDEEVKDGMDIALCSIKGLDLEYAGANNPLWIIRNNELIIYKPDKQPIGKFERETPFITHQVKLEKGDSIYLFSDGYVDQFGGGRDKKFKTKAFKKILLSIQHESMKAQKQILDKTFNDWKGEIEQLDDVCILGYRV